MRTYLDCLPCVMNQALRAATDDEVVQRQVAYAVARMIPESPVGLKPPEITQQSYRLINELTGNNDPFYQAKVEANRIALKTYPRLKQLVDQSADKLFIAFMLATAGNSIDMGPKFEYGSIENIINASVSCTVPLAVNGYDKFRNSLNTCRRLLYLGDNAGEIVFERLVIKEISRVKELEISYVVRGKPVINDVTIDDALAVDMEGVAKVVYNGSDASATVLSHCSEEMLQHYHSSDIIISTRQGNYESLEGERGNIIFLLRAKCPLVAKTFRVDVGDYVLKAQVQI